MRLYAPGMSVLHRAGLGGLAATLKYIERAYDEGMIDEEDLPGWPWQKDQPPWSIKPLEITLDFGQPENAGEYLRRLFRIAFDLKDDLIFLPGQYADSPPPLAVRALLQQGMTLTFLQHGRVRKLDKKENTYAYQPDGEAGATIELTFKKCHGYKHQDGWKELVDDQGRLKAGTIEVAGPLNPGAVVRHVAFTAKTRIEEDVAHILPLYFALVGCLTLPVNRGCGVLLVPEVTDLVRFAALRPLMTPTTDRDCLVTCAADAALQAQIRLRAKAAAQRFGLPGFYANTLQPTPWATQQKSRVQTAIVPPGREKTLDQFALALAELPPRIAVRKVRQTVGRGKKKQEVEKTEWFWVDSVARPLVAENLAQGRRWYQGFCRLMVAVDPVSKRPVREKLSFEKKGLQAMTEKIPWEDRGESTVVRAVHEAIRRRYGQIAKENKGNPVAMKNRWSGEYDRWRLAFAGAKTPDQFRRAICDLFSRAGINSVLQKEWQDLLPMLDASRWQLTRDLALLALASYTGAGAEDLKQGTEPQQPTADP